MKSAEINGLEVLGESKNYQRQVLGGVSCSYVRRQLRSTVLDSELLT